MVTHPAEGVLGMPPCTANSGATCRCGVVAEPTRATRCRSSPKMQPSDHISMAAVYPPRDITTCGKQQQQESRALDLRMNMQGHSAALALIYAPLAVA